MAMCVTAYAQLSIEQVIHKSSEAIDITDGWKGRVSAKMLGMGGTFDFASDGKHTLMIDGNERSYVADSTEYSVDTKKNTITIERAEEETYLMLLPFLLTNKKAQGKMSWDDFTMESNKKVYVLTLKKEGGRMTIEIDAKTFQPMCLKIKKGIITLMSFTYSDLKRMDDKSILVYDQSSFPGARIIDKRGSAK